MELPSPGTRTGSDRGTKKHDLPRLRIAPMKQISKQESGRRPSLLFWAAAAVLLLAVCLRAKEFFFARSLWMDEARLALNILERGYVALLAPLDFDQAAPPGYLWLTKLSTQLFGTGEKALRLPAFLASLLSLPFAWAASCRCLGARGALFVLFIVAICPMLIEYASELKQYQFDFLASWIVLHSAAVYLHQKDRPAASVHLAVVGSATLLFSHAVSFVTAGAGAALLLDELRRPKLPRTRRLLAAGFCVFLAGIANYLIFLRPILDNDALVSAHAWSFPEVEADSPPEILPLARLVLNVFNEPLGLYIAPAGALGFLLGLVWLAGKRGLVWTGMLAAPLILLLGAVIADRYSFFSKYLIFTIPLLSLGIAAGIEGLLRSRSKGGFVAGCLLAFVVLGQTAWVRLTDEDFWRPIEKEEIRPVLETLSRRIEEGDVILIYGPFSPFNYYTQWGSLRGRFAEHHLLVGWDHFLEYKAANPPFRMWMIRYHVRPHDRPRTDERLRWLRSEGRQLDMIVSKDARGDLFAVP